MGIRKLDSGLLIVFLQSGSLILRPPDENPRQVETGPSACRINFKRPSMQAPTVAKGQVEANPLEAADRINTCESDEECLVARTGIEPVLTA